MKTIYLDNNATTTVDPRVVDRMIASYRAAYANPASPHELGREARHALEQSREHIAELLGTQLHGEGSSRLIFTSGATESNNLAMLGITGPKPKRILISAIEHPSIVGPAEFAAQRGCRLEHIQVTPDGVIDLGHAEHLLAEHADLVSVMLGNNETGVIQPIEPLAALCAQQNVPMHTDAVQAIGKLKVNFDDLGVRAMSGSAHKFHGPDGIGFLLLSGDTKLHPLMHGGFHQAGARPGTESLVLAAGLETALQNWSDEHPRREQQMASLRVELETLISRAVPDLVIVGRNAPRLPHTSSLAFPGIDRQALLMALDLEGVACSTGSACASGSSDPSPVLIAMGLDRSVVGGALRFSLSAMTTRREILEAARRISRVVARLQGF